MRSLLSLPSLAFGALGVAASAVVVLAPPASAATPATTTPATTTSAATTPTPGTYVAVTAFRALEHTIRHGHTVTAQVGGRGRVPLHVAAVAITLTASSPTASGALTAYPSGTKRPVPQNLLYSAGRDSSVSAIVALPASGKLAVHDTGRSGGANVSVDVAGYYVSGAPSTLPGAMHTVTPRHALGTRTLGAHRSLVARIGGRAGVPASGVGAAAVLVHVIAPTRFGSVIAYRAGADRPQAPAATFVRGLDTVGFALVPVDSDGRIALYNASSGRARVAVDVLGYTTGGVVTAAGTTQLGTATRLINGARLKPREVRTMRVSADVPPTQVSAAVVTITAAARTSGAALVWQTGTSRFRANDRASDTTVVPVSPTGTIAVRNLSHRAITLSVDMVGYVPAAATPLTAPTSSNSRYIRRIDFSPSDFFSDPGTTGDGCVDATSGSTLVLLDFGAQLNNKSGVALTVSEQQISYDQLVTAIDHYLTGFATCAAPAHATIALGTNNGGDFNHGYDATARGTDWANKVVDAVTVPATLRVVGANDIEPAFSSTRAQAQAWEVAYLAATPAELIFNGSADGCSTTLGRPGGTCAYGWTMQQLYELAHNGSRVQVLPQVYIAAQAAQWANIDATGGGRLSFAGVLTEYQACPAASAACPTASYRPDQGWTALYHAISTVVAHPVIPAATDLRADG